MNTSHQPGIRNKPVTEWPSWLTNDAEPQRWPDDIPHCQPPDTSLWRHHPLTMTHKNCPQQCSSTLSQWPTDRNYHDHRHHNAGSADRRGRLTSATEPPFSPAAGQTHFQSSADDPHSCSIEKTRDRRCHRLCRWRSLVTTCYPAMVLRQPNNNHIHNFTNCG